jgi:histidinol dehydrogenase
MRRLDSASADFETQFQRLLQRPADADAAIDQRVAEIIADVRARGDAAVLDHTRRWDRLDATSVAALELTGAELRAAFESLPAEQRRALESAAERVRDFHARQLDAACRGFC